jgi:hypothetical protein
MHQEYLSLIHTDFNKDLVSSLKDYFTYTSLTDVTLVSDEQIPFKAHKFVLRASSPVMKGLLLSNPYSHPLIYLKGLKQEELLSILQFMYFGEANIYNNWIKKFLDIAKDLKLSGVLPEPSTEMLLKSPDKPSSNESDIQIYNNTRSNLNPDFKTPDSDIEENVSEETDYENETTLTTLDEFSDFNQCSDDHLLQKHIPSKHNSSKYKSKQFQSEQNVRYSCNQCEYHAPQLRTLKRHEREQHKGLRYACNINKCEYQATRPDNLKRHQESMHEESKREESNPEESTTLHELSYLNKCSDNLLLQKHIPLKHKSSKYKSKQHRSEQNVKYSCKQCEYQAPHLRSLKRHEREQHEGLRYLCNKCEYQTKRPDNLKRHEESKHEESKHEEFKQNVKYSCNRCEYQAMRQSDLTSHEKSKHRESNDNQSQEDVGYFCNKCEYHTT